MAENRSKKLDLKQFNVFGHSLPLLLDENTGKELVKSARKREDDIVKIDGKRRFHGAFTGGFSAGHWNTVGTAEGWAPQEFKSSRSDKFASKRQRPQDFMDDEDFGEFGIARKKITAVSDYSAGADSGLDPKLRESENVRFTIGLGLAAVGKIVSGSEGNWGNTLLRKLGWKDGQGIGARKRAKDNEVLGQLGRRVGPTMPSGNELSMYTPITFAPKDCCPIKFVPKSDNKGIGFIGQSFSSAMATNSRALSVTVEGRKLNIAGQAFGVGALEEEDDDIYAQDSMANYTFDLKTEKEQKRAKHLALLDEKNKFISKYGIEGPKVEGGHNDIMDGFVRGRPVKKSNKIKIPEIPRDYTGTHVFEKECSAGILINPNQQISRSVQDMAGKWKVETPEYVKGGRKKVLTAAERAELLGEKAPNIKRAEEPSEINFQCKWRDPDKQERYDRYCKNTKDGKLDPYSGLAPDDFTKWEIDKEKAEFERAATQKSAVSAIMMNRFKRAEFMDRDENVNLPKSKSEQKFQEKKDAVKMNFFGAMTHECYDWYPAKLLCRRFDVPEPYPGSQQVGCPYIEMLNNKSSEAQSEDTVQGIFGASTDEMRLFKTEKPPETENPVYKPTAPVAVISGLASASDLLKMEEDQFKSSAVETVAQMKPQKSLAEIKREMLTKVNSKPDRPKFEINAKPAPGTADSKLPSTVRTIVRETNFGEMSRPLSKQPSRFSSDPHAPVATDSAEISARKMRLQQRQEKVQEKLATVADDEKPPVDVFKSIFSDSESDSEDSEKEESAESEDEKETLTISKVPSNPPAEPAQNPTDPPGEKKLSWSRFSAPPRHAEPPKTEPPDEKMETDDLEPPKITFTAKKDRKTTKKQTKTENVKIEKIDSDSDMEVGPSLPSNFLPASQSQSFPDITGTEKVEVISDSDENCWAVAGQSKKSKKKKHKKEKKKKNKKEKKR